MWQLKSNPT